MYLFLSVIFFIGAVQGNPYMPVIPCKYNDPSCMIISWNNNYQRRILPNYPLVPLKLNTFTMNWPGMTLTFENPTLLGLGKCVFSDLTVDIPNRKLNTTYSCPEIIIVGNYRGSGRILDVMPVNGMGPFYQIIYRCAVSFVSDLEIYTGPDHEKYMNLTGIVSRNYIPTGTIIPKYKNLVYGDKFASHEAQHWLDENSRPFIRAYSDQMYDPFVMELLSFMNKFLANVPLRYVFSEPEHDWYTQAPVPFL